LIYDRYLFELYILIVDNSRW